MKRIQVIIWTPVMSQAPGLINKLVKSSEKYKYRNLVKPGTYIMSGIPQRSTLSSKSELPPPTPTPQIILAYTLTEIPHKSTSSVYLSSQHL